MVSIKGKLYAINVLFTLIETLLEFTLFLLSMFDSVFIGLYSGSTDTSFFLDSAAGVLGCTMDESLLLEGFDTG